MSQTPVPPGNPNPNANPSLESTRKDDQNAKALHEGAGGLGAAAGTGLGCLGIALGPWAMIAVGIVAAVIVGLIVRSCTH